MAADPDKLEDPHLIIYNAVLTLRKTHIVTNGDQTDTIARFMNGNLFPATALRLRWRPAPMSTTRRTLPPASPLLCTLMAATR